MIKVHCVTVGLLAENCYLVHEDGLTKFRLDVTYLWQ